MSGSLSLLRGQDMNGGFFSKKIAYNVGPQFTAHKDDVLFPQDYTLDKMSRLVPPPWHSHFDDGTFQLLLFSSWFSPSWQVRLLHTSPLRKPKYTKVKVPKINNTSAKQLRRATLPLPLPYKRPCQQSMLPHTHTRLTTCTLKNSTQGRLWFCSTVFNQLVLERKIVAQWSLYTMDKSWLSDQQRTKPLQVQSLVEQAQI